MRRRLPLIGGALLGLVAASCVTPYAPPTENEPHAVLKLRRVYEQSPGVSLREIVDLDDDRAYSETSPSGLASSPRTDSLLVHPKTVTAHVRTMFFHSEVQLVREQYTEYTQRMETETYSCSSGFGSTATYRTCSRTVMRSHPEQRWRTVTKAVDVPDGSCESSATFDPAAGHVYLLQYTYREHLACDLRCFEQIPTGTSGEFRNEACGP